MESLLRYNNLSFSKWRKSAILICGTNFETTHNENLMVFTTMQHLVGIALVVLTWKRLFTPFWWLPSSILDFQFFKHLVTHQVGIVNMQCDTNFIKNGHTLAEILQLTMFKMATVCHLMSLNLIFWTAGELWRINVCYRTKFKQNLPNDFGHMRFLDFQDDLCQPSWIFKSLIF